MSDTFILQEIQLLANGERRCAVCLNPVLHEGQEGPFYRLHPAFRGNDMAYGTRLCNDCLPLLTRMLDNMHARGFTPIAINHVLRLLQDDIPAIRIEHATRMNPIIPPLFIRAYCGRGTAPAGTFSAHLGNPYPITPLQNREAVIREFERDVVNGRFAQQLRNLHGIWRRNNYPELGLVCWCHPQPCHCAVIKLRLIARRVVTQYPEWNPSTPST